MIASRGYLATSPRAVHRGTAKSWLIILERGTSGRAARHRRVGHSLPSRSFPDGGAPRWRAAMRTSFTVLVALAALALGAAAARADGEPIGSVDTAFKLIGRNHQIRVQAFDDPKVPGVRCYVSQAV